MVNHHWPLTICFTNRVYCLYLLFCGDIEGRGRCLELGSQCSVLCCQELAKMDDLNNNIYGDASLAWWDAAQCIQLAARRCITLMQSASKLVTDNWKTSSSIATISSCLMWLSADPSQWLCTNRCCFLAGNCNCVALRENKRRETGLETWGMSRGKYK